MKTIVYSIKTFVLLVSVYLVFIACDKIEAPYTETPINPPSDTEEYVRKVLVEDYTGHTCGNCPAAAEVLNSILATYKDKVIAMGIHAGTFAHVATTGIFTYNFKTPEGTELDNFFGISNAGNPNGMINRKGYNELKHIIFHTDWSTQVDEELKKPAIAAIKLAIEYNTGTRTLTVNSVSKFLENLEGNYKLCLFITEDSIISAQKDYRLSGSAANVTNYKHKHVLRTSINSVWGEAIATGTIVKNTEVTKEHSINLNEKWNDKECAVVAYIYDSATYEIIQVEEASIISN